MKHKIKSNNWVRHYNEDNFDYVFDEGDYNEQVQDKIKQTPSE